MNLMIWFGVVFSMAGFSQDILNKCLKLCRSKVREICGPFTQYFIEHFNYDGQKKYCRNLINVSSDNTFKLVKCEIDLNYPSPFLNITELGQFGHFHLAKNRLEQEVTQLEQAGFEFIDELTKGKIDLFSKLDALIESKLTHYSLEMFLKRNKNHEVLVQDIPGGMHMVFIVDSSGETWMRPVGFKDRLNWLPAGDGYPSTVLRDAARVDGAMGFVCEGFFDGCRLYVTDILFLRDKWLFELRKDERVAAYMSFIKDAGILHPMVLEPAVVKMGDLIRRFDGSKALLISIPRAKPSYVESNENEISRVLVSQSNHAAAYFGERADKSLIELYDYDNLKYMGLAFLTLDIRFNGLTFNVCSFKAGDNVSAVYF